MISNVSRGREKGMCVTDQNVTNNSNFLILSRNLQNWYTRTVQEEFEDTKWVIRIRKSKKDRQPNDQTKKDKSKNNHLQTIQRKIKIKKHLSKNNHLQTIHRKIKIEKQVYPNYYNRTIFISWINMIYSTIYYY